MQLLSAVYRFPRYGFTTSMTHILYLSTLLQLPRTSNADLIKQEDHNHHRLLELQSTIYGSNDVDPEIEPGRYEPDFLGVDRSIIGRTATTPESLDNNFPGRGNILYGKTQVWKFPKEKLTSNATLYITLNICDQPQPKNADPNGAPAPLQLYVSTKNPVPNQNEDHAVPVVYGYGAYNMTGVSDDVYLGVTAPQKSRQFDGQYNYELTGSVDAPFATYIDDTDKLVLIDSDANATLLWTNETTTTTKYGVFVHPQNDPAILGLSSSFCGLKNWARRMGNIGEISTGDVETGLVKYGNETKQQFYVQGLNRSTAYYGIMALNGTSSGARAGDGTVGGGGQVWNNMSFVTKSSTNCAVIYNLTFCSDFAHAVPSNSSRYNNTELALLYDNDAKDKYVNFNKSLQQIPCNTTSSAQYSLARNCTHCADDYKTWLCAVTIPRCQDFSSNARYLKPRLVSSPLPNGTTPMELNSTLYTTDNQINLYMNGSRNPMIDDKIQPGPYKEILPCTELCYDIVRSCPASLGFTCPLKKHGLRNAYGEDEGGLEITCNYPRAPFRQNVAIGLQGSHWLMGAAFLVALLVI